jgi:hypothetical protein
LAGERRCPAENLSWFVVFKVVTGLLKKYDLTAEKPRKVPSTNLMLPYIRAPWSMTTLVQARRSALKKGEHRASDEGISDVYEARE